MFFVAIPRRSVRNSASYDAGETQAIVKSTEIMYRRVTKLDHTHISTIDNPANSSKAVLLTLDKEGEKSFSLHKGHWAVAAGVVNVDDLAKSMVRRAGRLSYFNPVWGTYAVLFAERNADRISAWHTSPSTEVIYYAQTAEHTFIGNRPLLVALALNAGSADAVELSRDFLIEYLLYGYSMTSQSPFTGVSVLTSRKSLTVTAGEIEISEFPTGLESVFPSTHTEQEAGEALAVTLRNATDRCLAKLNGRGLQVRVSGGKDSRIILGLLAGRDIKARGVTFGQSKDDEVLISNHLATMAGIDLEVAAAPLAPGDTHREKVKAMLKQADGIPLSEPHASVYSGSNSQKSGEGIMLGQWPLMKGGAASKMFYSAEAVERKILGQGAPIIRQTYRDPYDEFFREWIRSAKATSELEKLYLFSRDFRSSRWMIGLTTIYDRDASVVYPLADTEVAALSDALGMGEKIAQTAYFYALREIWPIATRVPTVGSRWKFESGGQSSRIDPEGYAERNSPVKKYLEERGAATHLDVPKAKSIEFLGSTAKELAQEIITSPFALLYESILTTDFWSVVEEWAAGREKLLGAFSRRGTIQFIWRVYVADVWYRRSWLEITPS